MTDIIYDFISTGVDLILIGGILSSLIIMLRGSTQLTNVISNQQATSTELDYYLQYHKYNDSEGMSSADALSALVGYRSDMNVFIALKDPDNPSSWITIYNNPSTGKYYKRSTYVPKNTAFSTTATGVQELSYDKVAGLLNSTYNYNAYLCTSGSGRYNIANFDRNTVVTGILLIHDQLDQSQFK